MLMPLSSVQHTNRCVRQTLSVSQAQRRHHMALERINKLHSRDLVEGIEDIVAFEESRLRRIRPALHAKMSEP